MYLCFPRPQAVPTHTRFSPCTPDMADHWSEKTPLGKGTPLDVYFLIWVNGKCGRGAGFGSCPNSPFDRCYRGSTTVCRPAQSPVVSLSSSLLVSSQPPESFTTVMRHQARNSRPVLVFVLEASHTHPGGQGANIGSCLRVYHSHPAKLGRATAVGTFRNHMTVSCTHFVLCHH